MKLQKLSIDYSHFTRKEILSVKKVRLTPAGCALDLGDGSERGEYVNQDYILHRLGRPVRAINLMYTYYPLDPEWPSRSSEAHPDMEVHGQWDYPYDDYFPYGGGTGGDRNAKIFQEMRDVRRHGEDVLLTLTTDCRIPDEEIIAIAKDLKPFGRLRLRVNHECAGRWFTHNRRYSYEEVGEFFVRFSRIIKEYAPNISMIFCSGFIGADGKMEKEDAFWDAFRAADIWSGDRYFTLHFGWPFNVCETGDLTYAVNPVDDYIEGMNKTVKRLTEICDGRQKPFSASEFNVDGDVTGPVLQGDSLIRFADYMEQNRPDWKYSLSLYQFRDRGRLGLEIEDPNNPEVGIPQPLMEDFKKLLKRPFFSPGVEEDETLYIKNDADQKEDGESALKADGSGIKEDGSARNEVSAQIDSTAFPQGMDEGRTPDTLTDLPLRWGGSEDADGLELTFRLEKTPVFFEVLFPEEANIMLSINGRWFYKAPGVRMIDLMPAFFSPDAPTVIPGQELKVLLFAPPADGENPETDEADWAENYCTTLAELPKFRIRYAPVAEV